MAGNLSYAQLKGTWLTAAKGTKYATNTWASLMAAIGEAESRGDPTATNPTDDNGRQTSWGIWQISTGNHNEPSPNWADPVTNAKLAIGKLNDQGLTAWGTYDSGAYRAFLSDKTAADTSNIAGPSAVDTAAITTANKTQAQCAWGIGWGGIPGTSWLVDLFGGGGNVGSGQVCVLSKSQARAILGVGLLLAGAGLIGFGVSIIATAAALPGIAGVATAVAAPEVAAAGAATSATRPSPPRRQGSLADSRGTSPEFRSQYGTAS